MERLFPLSVVLASLATSAAIVAGGMQTIAGRTESTRSHRFLSGTLWTVVVAGLAAALTCSFWLTHPKIDELDFFSRVTAAETGPWLVIEGFDEDRLPEISVGRQFLLNIDSGRSFPIDAGAGTFGLRNWRLSADGSRLLGYRRNESNTGLPVLIADLETSMPIVEETGWQLADGSLLALDDNGSRVAVLNGQLRLRVFDPFERKGLTMWRLDVPSAPRDFFGRLCFLGSETLRVTLIDRRMRTQAMIIDIDLQKRETRIIRRLSGKSIELTSGPSPVLIVKRQGGVGLLDVLRLDKEASDEHDSSLDVWIESPDRLIRAHNLGDSTAYIVKLHQSWELRFLSGEGREPTIVPLEGFAYELFTGLRRDEVLLLKPLPRATSHSPVIPQIPLHEIPLLRVDARTGATSLLEVGLLPLQGYLYSWNNSIASGSIGARVLRNARGEVVLLDANGKIDKVLIQAKSRASS